MLGNAFTIFQNQVLLAKHKRGKIFLYRFFRDGQIHGTLHGNMKAARNEARLMVGSSIEPWYPIPSSVRNFIAFGRSKVGCSFRSQAVTFDNRREEVAHILAPN
jgi:hypothetical protein